MLRTLQGDYRETIFLLGLSSCTSELTVAVIKHTSSLRDQSRPTQHGEGKVHELSQLLTTDGRWEMENLLSSVTPERLPIFPNDSIPKHILGPLCGPRGLEKREYRKLGGTSGWGGGWWGENGGWS